jgi:hypothetical protein
VNKGKKKGTLLLVHLHKDLSQKFFRPYPQKATAAGDNISSK